MQHITTPRKSNEQESFLPKYSDIKKTESKPSGTKADQNSDNLKSNILKRYLYRLLTYLSLSLALYVTFEIFSCQLQFNDLNYLTMHVRRFVDALIFALPVWFISRKLPIFIWLLIIEIFLNANLIYYQYYGALIPFSSYKLIGNLNGLGDSIVQGIDWRNLWILLPVLIWFIGYSVSNIGVRSSKYYLQNQTKIIISACTSLMICVAATLPSYIVGNPHDYGRPKGLFSHDPIRAFKQFGWIHYMIYEFHSLKGVSEQEKSLAVRELKAMEKEWAALPAINTPKNKNLIIILVESLGSWPIGLKVNNESVTPEIERLISSDSTIYMSKVLPQVKHGRSSDAQLLINTGLLPISEGAASSLYASNNYPSIVKALKARGYSSSLYLCDRKDYWNQSATAVAYGIDDVHDRLAAEENVLSDGKLFTRAIPQIKKQKQPFYTMLVTMSGHDPIRGKLKSKFHQMEFATENARNIAAIVNYTDSCIGSFIRNLKASGLYDNSVIVITGDHDGVGKNAFDGREHTLPEDRYIPLIIINAPPTLRVDENSVMGQSDIYPSLLDVMGISDYGWRGVGESIFRPRESGAIYRDMTSVGEMTPNTLHRRAQAWTISDILIRMNWFGMPPEK